MFLRVCFPIGNIVSILSWFCSVYGLSKENIFEVKPYAFAIDDLKGPISSLAVSLGDSTWRNIMKLI